jgi:hypothetical protein
MFPARLFRLPRKRCLSAVVVVCQAVRWRCARPIVSRAVAQLRWHRARRRVAQRRPRFGCRQVLPPAMVLQPCMCLPDRVPALRAAPSPLPVAIRAAELVAASTLALDLPLLPVVPRLFLAGRVRRRTAACCACAVVVVLLV